MNYIRAVIIAIIVWILGVALYTIGLTIDLMANKELQGNIVVALAILPLSMCGAKVYYRNGSLANGLVLGVLMFIVTAFLDGLVTVPFFIIPEGGSYSSFYGDVGFWLIGMEYVGVVWWTSWSVARSTTTRQ
ncbi:DUF5367 family protein [Reichenbachiella versicolor]|uniref:DUF5367 family protein n=1 Tax=Reichenbachiella versicolor TaxID=1821036 RepID=UPI000D6E5298|nr:DUF5367 family protein [Reichenbachiella versicolor]